MGGRLVGRLSDGFGSLTTSCISRGKTQRPGLIVYGLQGKTDYINFASWQDDYQVQLYSVVKDSICNIITNVNDEICNGMDVTCETTFRFECCNEELTKDGCKKNFEVRFKNLLPIIQAEVAFLAYFLT
jgi:hypothetical protein